MKKMLYSVYDRAKDTSHWFNRNTGYLLLASIIVFGFMAVSSQQRNRAILDDTHKSVENGERILKRLETVVTDIKEDGKARDERQNRLLVCLLVIHGETQIISPEARKDCENDANDIVNQFDAERQSSQPNPNPREETSPTTPKLPNNGEENPDPPTTGEEPNLIERIVEPVTKLIEGIL